MRGKRRNEGRKGGGGRGEMMGEKGEGEVRGNEGGREEIRGKNKVEKVSEWVI